MKYKLMIILVVSYYIALLLLLVCLPMRVQAQPANSVTLAWDANTEPDLAGYNILMGETSGTYPNKWKINDFSAQWNPQCTGTYDPFNSLCCEFTLNETLFNFEIGKTYYFVGTAFDHDGNVSAYSEELTHVFTSHDKIETLIFPNIEEIASSKGEN